MQKNANFEKGLFCPINRLFYDNSVSVLILAAICGQSLAQSFVISLTLTLASSMQLRRTPQGDMRGGINSRATYLSSPRDAKKNTTHSLSVF